jgi:hypothetical protein
MAGQLHRTHDVDCVESVENSGGLCVHLFIVDYFLNLPGCLMGVLLGSSRSFTAQGTELCQREWLYFSL